MSRRRLGETSRHADIPPAIRELTQLISDCSSHVIRMANSSVSVLSSFLCDANPELLIVNNKAPTHATIRSSDYKSPSHVILSPGDSNKLPIVICHAIAHPHRSPQPLDGQSLDEPLPYLYQCEDTQLTEICGRAVTFSLILMVHVQRQHGPELSITLQLFQSIIHCNPASGKINNLEELNYFLLMRQFLIEVQYLRTFENGVDIAKELLQACQQRTEVPQWVTDFVRLEWELCLPISIHQPPECVGQLFDQVIGALLIVTGQGMHKATPLDVSARAVSSAYLTFRDCTARV